MIDWFGFLTVALTTLIGAGFVVTMYSLGVRFTAVSGDDTGRSNLAAKWGAYVCFGFCVLAVASGIILIVPALSKAAETILGNIF
ncbi:hypothetical protein ART_0777 [Arthrobacter sp. PAMC 25486]|uniref:hypothetical protein n=1 Tax=Arthrobacter sp. PAMC 25486 TaxID=1494608 RepID=UPI000535B403|nr:hypothetical protein [Arthrobacter sp. PAMC 25486]AIY00376.1 hypothetical protein ART_0777 [Arthrobacter sp. PAMC 25486]